MSIEKIDDHEERAEARLPRHLETADKFRQLVQLYAARIQAIDDELVKLLDLRAISTAAGAQLDGIGEILDLERGVGQSDADYRADMFGRTAELQKSGEIDTLIVALTNLTGASDVRLHESFPVTVHMTYDTAVFGAEILAAMKAVKAAGVNISISTTAGAVPFVTAGDPSGLGLSDVGFLNGGSLVEVFQ